MLPLVLAQQVRRTLLDYLRTTFRLRDHALERALFSFLQHPDHGIFRGPYLDVRLPFRQSAASDPVPLDVHPSFPPYAHQLQAWHRLTTAASHRPRPTLVTTGTGSGKTECFLYPLLDHCAREHAAGNKHGIKAIILYPMNALASDQAERIARELWNNPRLKNKVRAGLYVGGQTSASRKLSGRDFLIDDRDTLRQSPPDILLTNYRMLDFLLMRPEDSRLWQHNSPTTLQYLVLDELHTYDGAQGSDVACLIRRLRERLDIPADHLCPVGTSATIGSGGDEAKRLLLRFASDVFGAPFEDDAIIGESRLSIDEAFPADDVREDFPDLDLPPTGIDPLDPATHDTRAAYLDAQARLWLGIDASDPVVVGDELKAHDFLRVVLRSLHAGRHAGPRNLDDVCAAIAEQDPDFAKLDDRQPLALVSFLSLVSHARQADGERRTPLLHVQVQYWIRELRHLVRRVGGDAPTFDWRDEIHEDDTAHFLPIVYCRECGHDGLGAIMREGEDKLIEHDVGQAWLSRRRIARFVELGAGTRPEPLPDGAAPEQQEIPSFLCTRCLRCSPGQTTCSVQDCPGKTIPARLHAKLSEKKKFLADCPRCHAADGLSMLGSRAASLSSVAISELFLSPYNDDRKLLAFSDSVQDASHRAGFFAGRTFRFGMRTAIQSTLEDADAPIPLPAFADRLVAHWIPRLGERRLLATFMPPDLREHPLYEKAAEVEPGKTPRARDMERAMALLRARIGWEVTRELGLGVVLGRSLEATGCATLELPHDAIAKASEALALVINEERPVQLRAPVSPETVAHWLEGLLFRQRRRGGVHHPFLERYAKTGRRYWLSKTREPRLSRPGRQLPRMWVLGHTHQVFDPLYSKPNAPGWARDFTARALGLEVRDGGIDDLLRRAIGKLEDVGVVRIFDMGKERSAGLDPAALVVTRDVGYVHCPRCGTESVLPALSAARWRGHRCLTFRCAGTLAAGRYDAELPASDYYRRLYRSGRIERIFAEEHTGLLPRADRESVERRFKAAGGDRLPDAPNLLTCTPTLEMGIDIGDLSSVMLCSVPPLSSNYLQRVGRAGRKTGNALVLTFANARPHDQYFFAEPLEMMAGEVAPPGCFLDAPEMLMRQMAAYAMDRWSRQETDPANGVKNKTKLVLGKRGEQNFPGCFYRYATAHQAELTERFIALFSSHLSAANVDVLRDFGAKGSVVARMQEAFDAVRREIKQLKDQIEAANERREQIEADPSLAIGVENDPQERMKNELDEIHQHLRGLRRLREELGEKYPLNVLTDYGVLPNYAFPETGVTLKSILRGLTKEEQGTAPASGAAKGKTKPPPKEATEYLRPASAALREFAPFNTFYAQGHKLKVTQVDLGTTQQPLTEEWRLCPSCSYAERVLGTAVAESCCPQCQHPGWEDDGQKRTMVHFRRALSVMSLLDAVTDDSSEDRERQQYRTLELIDARPAEHGKGGWLIENDRTTFGIELLEGITIREVNFGVRGTTGLTFRVAGTTQIQEGFIACRHCGKIQEHRGRSDHAPYCKVRSGSAQERWEDVYLYRQMPSEALRLLLPMSQSHDLAEALPSFRAALQLGLRKRYHGYPQHLKITNTTEPVDSGGSARRQFLLVYDAVPGGTGYLADLAREGVLYDVLELALDAMRSCRCRAQERDGCYRCVYAYQEQRDHGKISRTRAENLFARIVESRGEAKRVASLSEVSIDRVLESELEERFVQEMAKFVHGRADWTWEADVPYEHGRCWRIVGPDRVWRLEPQVNLGPKDGVALACRPDFVLRCLSDGSARPIAIFCDGFRFHACPEKDNARIEDDLAKRRALLRSERFWVWTVTWKDVVQPEPPNHEVSPPTLLAKIDKRAMHQAVEKIGRGRIADVLEMSCLDQLRAYLETPDDARWRATAVAVGFGLLELRAPSATEPIQRLRHDLESRPVTFDPPVLDRHTGQPTLLAGHRHADWTQLLATIDVGSVAKGQLGAIRFLLRLFDEKPGRGDPEFEASWRAFFQAWNLLQFHPDGFRALSSEELVLEAEPAPAEAAAPEPAPPRRRTREIPRLDEEPIDLPAGYRSIADEFEEAKDLMVALHAAGLPPPEEFEGLGGARVEVEAILAWPDLRVGVALEIGDDDARVWARHGWRAFVVDDVDAIVAAVRAAAPPDPQKAEP